MSFPTETVTVESPVTIPIDRVVSLDVSCVPLTHRDGSFKKWEKKCHINVRVDDKVEPDTNKTYTYTLSRNELKRVKKLLTDYYGRNLRLTSKKVYGHKAKQASRQLPENQREYYEVEGVNWTYEVLAPPFAKIAEHNPLAPTLIEKGSKVT